MKAEKKLTADQKKLASEFLRRKDLGSLHVHDYEYVFAWMMLYPDAVRAAVQASEGNARVKSRALAAVDSFLCPHTDEDRYPVRVTSSTGRVHWKLDLLRGVTSAQLLVDLYCERNVTMQQMAEEIACLHTSPRGKEILKEAARRDAADAETRRQKKEQEAREAEVAAPRARTEKMIEARWQILKLVRDLEDEMSSYAENLDGLSAKSWAAAHKILVGAHDRALRALNAQLVPLRTERVRQYQKLQEEHLKLESKLEEIEERDGKMNEEDEARYREMDERNAALEAEMRSLQEALTPEEDWALGVDCGSGKGDWRTEYVLP